MKKSVVVCLNDLEEFDTAEQKIDHLKTEIKEASKLFNETGKASVEVAVRLGSMLNILKELIKSEEKKSWEKYLNNKSPINKRTAQRCMKLANTLGDVLQKNVKLSWAGKTRLLQLVSLAKVRETTVETILDESNISLDFDPKKVKEVKSFNSQIDSLIYANKDEKKSGKQDRKKGIKSILQLEEIVDSCSFMLEEKKRRKDFLSYITSDGMKQIIRKMKNLLQQLKKAKERISNEIAMDKAA